MPPILATLNHFHVAEACLLMLLGYFTARFVSHFLSKVLSKRMTRHQTMLFQRFVFYTILFLFIASVVQQLGFHITALLGATGIITVAIGIASQTSISNFISGIFILGEKPFEIGDTIEVNNQKGEVLSIDYLSVKIRTSDNTLVRIPNETLIKSSVSNLSFFPLRCFDFTLGVDYREDLDAIKNIFLGIGEKNPFCLADPAPSLAIANFGETAISIQFSVWAKREEFKDLKNTLTFELKKVLMDSGIHLVSTRGIFVQCSEPLQVKMISDAR